MIGETHIDTLGLTLGPLMSPFGWDSAEHPAFWATVDEPSGTWTVRGVSTLTWAERASDILSWIKRQ